MLRRTHYKDIFGVIYGHIWGGVETYFGTGKRPDRWLHSNSAHQNSFPRWLNLLLLLLLFLLLLLPHVPLLFLFGHSFHPSPAPAASHSLPAPPAHVLWSLEKDLSLTLHVLRHHYHLVLLFLLRLFLLLLLLLLLERSYWWHVIRVWGGWT